MNIMKYTGKEDIQMLFCSAGIAIVVVAILILIAMGIVF